MIDKKKQYALAMLSATSLIYVAGSSITVNANESIGVVTTYSLNVRSGPSTNNSRIGNVVKGQSVNILSSKDGWYQIKYNSGTGWVSGQYISMNSSSDSTASAGKKVTATAGLNVRSGGSTSYAIISYIKKGETVEVLGTSSTGWYKVKLNNGKIGYASNQYLTENTSSDTGSTTPESQTPENSTTLATLYTTANLNVRSGPSTSYRSISVTPKGSAVSVIEYTNSSWYKVKLSNGKIGYCSKSYLSSNTETNKPPTPETSKPETSNPGASGNIGGHDISKTMEVKAYAYYTGTITASGTVPTPGRTIAVDTSLIPLGSKIYIPQFDKVFIAEDRGGGIKGNKVDIFMSTREECINWGVRTITLQILK